MTVIIKKEIVLACRGSGAGQRPSARAEPGLPQGGTGRRDSDWPTAHRTHVVTYQHTCAQPVTVETRPRERVAGPMSNIAHSSLRPSAGAHT